MQGGDRSGPTGRFLVSTRYLAAFQPRQVPHLFTDIRNSLKSLMWRACGVRRDAEGLAQAAENVGQRCRYVLSRQFANPIRWELQNMLTVARVIIEAASLRSETRGSHARTHRLPQSGRRTLGLPYSLPRWQGLFQEGAVFVKMSMRAGGAIDGILTAANGCSAK